MIHLPEWHTLKPFSQILNSQEMRIRVKCDKIYEEIKDEEEKKYVLLFNDGTAIWSLTTAK